MNKKDIDDLTIKALKKKMKELIDFLDEYDGMDTFGTEGWRHTIGWED